MHFGLWANLKLRLLWLKQPLALPVQSFLAGQLLAWAFGCCRSCDHENENDVEIVCVCVNAFALDCERNDDAKSVDANVAIGDCVMILSAAFFGRNESVLLEENMMEIFAFME